MMKTIRIAAASAICLSTIISCQREEPVIDSTTDLISAKVREVSSVTKSAGFVSEELTQTMVLDGSGLLLQEYVSDNLSQPFPSSIAETKGTVVTSDNIAEEYGEFGMDAFLDNYADVSAEELSKFGRSLVNTDQYINGGQVSYNDGDWVLTDGSGKPYPWLHGMWYSFWSYAPKGHLGTFTYGSAGSRSAMSITNYSNPLTSADQKDLLIAYNHRSYNSGDSKTIDINFRHALADVYFDVTAITDHGYTVESIKIIGAYCKGTCAIQGADLADSDVTKAFTWTPDNASASDFEMTACTDHFFMVPQTLPEGAKLSITLTKDGVTFSPMAFSFNTTWLAGKYYKYVLTFNEKLDVDVEENCSDAVKTDVSVKNTGNCPAYIRAAVVANWFNDEGQIVASWDMTQGTFEGFPGTDWEAGDDGFYYYKKVVQAGENTENLLDSYTKPTATGMHLEMKVMAQGIKYVTSKTYKTVWTY